MGGARAENRCSGAGADWLPSTWDTAADEAECPATGQPTP